MVLNRLCNPDSKLGVLRWLETVAIPGLEVKAVTHQQLLRSMDALVDHSEAVDRVVAALLRPMIDQAAMILPSRTRSSIAPPASRHKFNNSVRSFIKLESFCSIQFSENTILSPLRHAQVTLILADIWC